jgi:hypothetical protein
MNMPLSSTKITTLKKKSVLEDKSLKPTSSNLENLPRLAQLAGSPSLLTGLKTKEKDSGENCLESILYNPNNQKIPVLKDLHKQFNFQEPLIGGTSE